MQQLSFTLVIITLTMVSSFLQPNYPCRCTTHRILRTSGDGCLFSADDDARTSTRTGDVNHDTPLIEPTFDMTAEVVVTACMDAMLTNDIPYDNHGLEVCFDFSSEYCRAALGGSLDEFISYASNPTFSTMTNALEYSVLSVGPVIQASMTRGAMQTVLVKVKPAKGDDRRFLW